MTFEAFIAATFVAHQFAMTIFFPSTTFIYALAVNDVLWMIGCVGWAIIGAAFTETLKDSRN